MSKKNGNDTAPKQSQNKSGYTITIDKGCPYCQGRRGHSSSQRKACKSKGILAPEAGKR